MIYLKSMFAGIVAVAVSLFVLSVGGGIYLWITAPTGQGNGTIAWDPISIGPSFLVVILAIFMAGFAWEFRHASR
jgi:hypothetical protein